MIIKRILFFVCFFFAVITVVSNFTLWSMIIFTVCMYGIYMITHDMTEQEFYTLTGANWLNRVFNTNSFTEE